jgi:hypothetical protein
VNFKLILALVDQTKVDPILKAAREAGATGATVITSARGEGLVPKKTFLGLDLAAQRDVVLLVVEEHLCPRILENVASAGRLDTERGAGIAIQLNIEATVGLGGQIDQLSQRTGEHP